MICIELLQVFLCCHREVYLDGNDFGCLGAGKLIAALVDQAENEQNERRIQEEARIAAEEEVKRIAG